MATKLPEHFCIVPFVHFSCKPDGSPRVCSFSQDSYVRQEDGEKFHLSTHSIDEIFHSRWMNSFRNKMISDEIPVECRFCHKEEAAGKSSKRLSENRKYLSASDEVVSCAQKKNGQIESPPIYFDLRLGNLCNLKCRTCNPLFSSSWAREVEAYPDSKVLQAYQGDVDRARASNSWHKNPDFWTQFHSIAGSIEEIYLTGGEPMMIKEHYSLLKFFTENDFAKNIFLRYNTNLTLLPDEFLKYAPHFKKISFSCSIDGYGEKNDWLRTPSKWETMETNFQKTLTLPKTVHLDINCTVSIFNILYFDELFLHFKNISRETGRHCEVFPDILHEPNFMQMKLLPQHLKDQAKERLNNLLSIEDLSASEKRNISSLVKMLDVVDEDPESKRAELKQHILELDKIRNENFVRVFPELAELVE